MIHYAALPPELIFEGCESYRPEYLRIPFQRGVIIVEPVSPAGARIIQLISSDLQDYLDPRFQPGRIVDLFSGAQAPGR